jgi:hypothetical protein
VIADDGAPGQAFGQAGSRGGFEAEEGVGGARPLNGKLIAVVESGVT